MPTIITRGGMSGKGFGLTAGGPALASYTFTTSTSNASLNISTITGYVAGKTIVTVTVNSGVYLWASGTGNYGLTLTGGTTGDTLTLVNNGYIIGCGGVGGNYYGSSSSGGPALSLGFDTSITNNSYIAGGGGGAGAFYAGGGGGSGGGNGGVCFALNPGGAGGSIGSTGGNGSSYSACGQTKSSGGGGGRQLPGSGGGTAIAGGRGGGAGGGGGTFICSCNVINCYGGSGGSSNGSGANAGTYSAGGGGGWGASGGRAGMGGGGSAGGAAISKNGHTLTYITTGNVWGSVS